MKEFLVHLEKLKEADEGSNGVILIFHEQRKFVPYMIIEAMKKYDLLARFMDTVKSTVNTYSIAVDKLGNSMKFISLRQMAKVLLNANDDPDNFDLFEGNAAVRAKLTYDIVEHIARGKTDSEATPDQLDSQELGELIRSYGHLIDLEIGELKEQECILQRQSTFRPIFLQYFKTTLRHRVRAVNYRRILAEHGYDLAQFKAMWDELKRDGIAEAISKLDELKEDDRNELINIIDHHFDPEKQPMRPKTNRNASNRRRRSRSRMNGNNNNNNNNNQNMRNGKQMQNGHNNNNNKEHLQDKGSGNQKQQQTQDGLKKDAQKQRPRRFVRNRNNRNRNNRPLIAAN